MSGQYVFAPPPPPPARTPTRQPYQTTTGANNTQLNARGGLQYQTRGRGDYSNRGRLPPGTFINPNFGRSTPQSGCGNHVHASQRGHTRGSYRGASSSVTSHHADPAAYPTRTTAGHKRKLDALRGSENVKLKREGPETAPSVPSFGLSLPSTQAIPAPVQQSTTHAPPRKSLFGLNSDQSEDDVKSSGSDDDNEADEEAMYAALGNKLVFEYDGVVMKLNSEADLAKWQEERRKRYPTSARVSAKEQERREQGIERKRLLAGAYALRNPSYRARLTTLSREKQVTDVGRSGADFQDQNQPTAAAIEGDAAQLEEVASVKGLPGITMYDSEDELDDAVDDSPSLPQPEKQIPIAGEQQEDSDLDEGPEEATTKETAPSTAVTQAVDTRPACKQFVATGRCRHGDNCHFRHEVLPDRPLEKRERKRPKRNVNGGSGRSQQKGIHQLLLNQENEAADKLALQVIKYLGGIGFFSG